VARAWLTAATVSALAGVASAQSLELTLVPSSTSVTAGETFSVDVVATWTGIPDSGNGNALAGYGLRIDAVGGADGVAGIGFDPASDLNPSLATGTTSSVAGSELSVVSGQAANILGFNPSVLTAQPITLFRFDVETTSGFGGTIDLGVVGQINSAGLVLIYDDSQSGLTTSFALNDSDTVVVGAQVDVLNCPADLTGGPDGGPDGVVDANDFFAYLGLFAASDPAADLTGGTDGGPDGIIDANDFFEYLGLFAAGCP